MRCYRLTRDILGPLVLIGLFSGCQSLYRERPVAVMVRDAETKQPIARAEVEFSHPLSESSSTSNRSVGATEADGVSRMSATPGGDRQDSLYVKAAANRYQSDTMLVPNETLEKIKPLGWFEAKNRRPVEIIMELYSGAPFTVELVVPQGYRGLVKASIQIRDEMPCTPGQRLFSYYVNSGSVQVVGPAVLRRVQPVKFVAKYADGIALVSGRADASQLVFHWLKHEDSCEYFVVGTEADIAKYRRQLYPDDTGTSSPSGNKSGGGRGGKGGGRGGAGSGNFGGPNGFSQ
jgi:hypothetical protein